MGLFRVAKEVMSLSLLCRLMHEDIDRLIDDFAAVQESAQDLGLKENLNSVYDALDGVDKLLHEVYTQLHEDTSKAENGESREEPDDDLGEESAGSREASGT